MKRIGYLYEKIYDYENIVNAIKRASEHKQDRMYVRRVLDNIEESAIQIQNMLIYKTFTPAEYKEIHVKDGISQKERLVHQPKFFPDQIIHWALILQMEEILMRGMCHYNCGSIKGRGPIYAKNVVEGWLRSKKKEVKRNTKYCFKLDISKFYPSVNKEILKGKFRKIIKDGDCLDLIDSIIDSNETGLPIGNYTSQWFANFYLQDLDHYVKEKLKAKFMIRYMDDVCIFGSNKRELHRIENEIAEFLLTHSLKMNSKRQVFNTYKRRVDFCGFQISRHKTRIRKRLALRVMRVARKVSGGKYSAAKCRSLMSYMGWIKHSDSYQFQQKYIEPINMERVRRVIRNEDKKHNKTRRLRNNRNRYSEGNSQSRKH